MHGHDEDAIHDTGYMWRRLSEGTFPGGDDPSFLRMDMDAFFTKLLAERGIRSRGAVIRMVGADKGQRSYYYDIMNGKKQALLDYYVRIALALALDLRTTQRMLAISRYGCMHPRIRRHAAAIFAINHGYSIARYEAFVAALEEAPAWTDSVHDAHLPDTEAMWDLLAGDAFPKAGYLLENPREFFDGLLAEYGLEKHRLIEKALLHREYGYEILGGRVNASRDYYVRIALMLGLDLRTTQRMLAVAGCGCLHARVQRDGAIVHAIHNRFDYDRTTALMADLQLEPLDHAEKSMR